MTKEDLEQRLKGIERVKNYKELCNILGWKVKGGNAKILQLKELGRYIEYFKDGNSFVIEKIKDVPDEKIDRRVNNTRNFKDFKEFHIAKEYWNSIGIYSITNYKTKERYIGSTIVGFRHRFKEHRYNSDSKMSHTQNLLNNGGIFEILLLMDNRSEVEIRKCEQDEITKALEKKEYILINKFKEVYYKGKTKPKLKMVRDVVEVEKYIKKGIKPTRIKYDKGLVYFFRNDWIEL